MRATCFGILLLALALTAGAGEKRKFFGEWEPPNSLAAFWAPLDDSWWTVGDLSRLQRYCQNFAKRADAKGLLPDIICDLKANPSVEREAVYLMLALSWNKSTILPLLEPYSHSADSDIRHIATDFMAEIEDTD